MIDYHMHSDFSADGKQTIDKICKVAIERNLSEIAITDHLDIEYPYDDIVFDFDIKKRERALERAREKYPQIRICNGIEIGLTPSTLEGYEEYLKKNEFDFVIASTHIVNGVDPYYKEFFEGRTKKQAYEEYLINRLECLKKYDSYNVVGHLGYPSRFVKEKKRTLEYNDYVNIIDDLLKHIIYKGKGIEVNTKGIMSTGDALPSKSIIRRYKELGGEIITVGSDAHIPSRIGDEIENMISVLKDIGFKYISTFKDRKPIQKGI